MFPSNPRIVLALLAVSSFGNFLVFVDGRCKIEPVDGHVNWPSNRKKIKKNAFKNCKELVTICIPPEVESIHNTAFVKSGLDLTKLYEVPCDADPSPLFSFKGPLQIVKSVNGEPATVLAAPPTDYFLQFNIELKSINNGWTSIITLTNDGYANPDYLYGQWVPGVYFNYNSTVIAVYYGDDEDGSNRMDSQPLELNKKSTVLIKVYGTTATISVNGVIESTKTIGTRSQLNDVEFYIGDPWTVPADAIISDISFGSDTMANDIVVDPPPLFSLKGPLQIKASVEEEPAAVLAALPTDYFLQFTIELKSISNWKTSIIALAKYPDYLEVYVKDKTTEIVVGGNLLYYSDDEDGSRGFFSRPLELNKKSTVLIKVYGTTATISVNGVIDTSQTVGPRSQLNDVNLYIGDFWSYPADGIVSDISFGLV